MFKPITKWSWSIRNPDSIPEIIRRAFKISLAEKSGAVPPSITSGHSQKEL